MEPQQGAVARLTEIRGRIARAAADAGRAPGAVTLVCVSKTFDAGGHPASKVLETQTSVTAPGARPASRLGPGDATAKISVEMRPRRPAAARCFPCHIAFSCLFANH